MIDPGPGPLGLCPVRGIVEVEQDSSIWLANNGLQPIPIEKDEVVAMAECVLAEPGASAGNNRDDGDEVNGLVERASPHLTSIARNAGSCRQPWQHANIYLQKEKVTLDAPISFSIRSTRAINPPLSNESDATQQRTGRRNGNWLRTCRPSGSSKQQCVEQSDHPGEEKGWNDAVLYRLPTTQSSHEGRRLPAPSH